jgi:hypothetical protein
MKRARGFKGKTSKTKKGSEQYDVLTGAQALELKEAIDGGQKLDETTLLHLLKAHTPCHGLYSKECKVRR